MQKRRASGPACSKLLVLTGSFKLDLVRYEFFDFFLQPEFLFLQLGDVKVAACRMVPLRFDLIFKGLMPVREFGNVGLQSHNLPTFVGGLAT